VLIIRSNYINSIENNKYFIKIKIYNIILLKNKRYKSFDRKNVTMIIYENTKYDFINDVKFNKISDKIKNNMVELGISGGSPREIQSWINSMNFMRNAIDSEKISNDTYIAIEYKIPFSNKRIDFMIFGKDNNKRDNFIIVELKQWNLAEDTNKNDLVKTYVGNGIREVLHPSYQAMEYLHLINDFNKSVRDQKIKGYSCAYLHNADEEKNSNLKNTSFYSFTEQNPIYFKDDVSKLQNKIISLVGKGKGKEILYVVEKGEIVPSKKLIDTIKNTLKGKKEYVMIGSQKIVYENIMYKTNEMDNVFLINGNPSTGKSVVAINLLSSLLEKKKKVLYIAPNASFKNVIIDSLKISKNEYAFNVLIKGSSGLWNAERNTYDWVIVDEAHRLKKQAYMYKGKNQIMDILNSSKNVVFFIDERQVIRKGDIGTNSNISELSLLMNKKIYSGEDYTLDTQFRCSGANGYINAIETVLQIENGTGNFYLNEDLKYDFKICETPQEMENLLNRKKEEGFHKSRIIAGFAWKWETKKMNVFDLQNNKDIKIPEHNYEIAWNHNDGKMLWAVKDDNGIPQAGCVHTAQGLEFEYCGVIIGNDLKIDQNGNLYADYDEHYDIEGKKGLKNDNEKLTELIKNIYRILLSRGTLGTYVFIRDPKVREYFRKHLK
ncbi:MAG: DNA/RNA helicase domain-containing protein, partial [Metamycoplasmataceae bacterium]